MKNKSCTTSVTFTDQSLIESGDIITFTTPDNRWWMRLWRFVTFRSSHVIASSSTVVSVKSNTITIE